MANRIKKLFNKMGKEKICFPEIAGAQLTAKQKDKLIHDLFHTVQNAYKAGLIDGLAKHRGLIMFFELDQVFLSDEAFYTAERDVQAIADEKAYWEEMAEIEKELENEHLARSNATVI